MQLNASSVVADDMYGMQLMKLAPSMCPARRLKHTANLVNGVEPGVGSFGGVGEHLSTVPRLSTAILRAIGVATKM